VAIKKVASETRQVAHDFQVLALRLCVLDEHLFFFFDFVIVDLRQQHVLLEGLREFYLGLTDNCTANL
jgi:hypothetical protein